jgi:hypothetical protein
MITKKSKNSQENTSESSQETTRLDRTMRPVKRSMLNESKLAGYKTRPALREIRAAEKFPFRLRACATALRAFAWLTFAEKLRFCKIFITIFYLSLTKWMNECKITLLGIFEATLL